MPFDYERHERAAEEKTDREVPIIVAVGAAIAEQYSGKCGDTLCPLKDGELYAPEKCHVSGCVREHLAAPVCPV